MKNKFEEMDLAVKAFKMLVKGFDVDFEKGYEKVKKEYLKILKEPDDSEAAEIKKNLLPTLNLDELEKMAVITALENNSWVQNRAAKDLGISTRNVNYYVKKYGLTHQSWRKNI